MLVAVSPYHLTTREPAAAAALLLADQVVTLLPAPFSGRRDTAQAAAERLPKYLDFMMSWQWSVPLWEAGVICSALSGEDAATDVRAAFDQIAADDRYKSLRTLMKPEVFEAEDAYLEAVARDLLKGGPDPGITVPVAAGMDRFAMRHGAAVARSHPSSVVQKAEEQLGARVFAVVIPILLQASAQRLLEAREALEPELTALRRAIDAQLECADPVPPKSALRSRCSESLATAAASYTRAFESMREDLLAPDPDDDTRIIDGAVAITGMLLPADAVLTSSLTALRTLSPSIAATLRTPAPTAQPNGKRLADQRFLTLLIRVIGRSAPTQTTR